MVDKQTKTDHSLGYDLKIIWHTLKLIQSLAPWSIITLISLALCEAFLPFVNLFLPAMIIDELLDAQSMNTLTQLVTSMLAFNVLLGTISRSLTHARTYQMALVDLRLTQAMAIQTTNMDFSLTEDPTVQRLRQKAYEGRSWMGNIASQLVKIGQSLQDALAIMASLGIVIQLITTPAVGGYTGILGFIDNPQAFLLLGGCMVFAVSFNGWLNMHKGQMVYKQMAAVVPANRNFSYVIELFADYHFGKDIRLFNMSAMLIEDLRRFVSFNINSFWPIFKEGMTLDSFSIGASTLLTGLVYLYVTGKALIGAISIGSIMLFIGAISQLNSGISGIVSRFAQIRMCCLYAQSYLDYLNLPSAMATGDISFNDPKDKSPEIEFHRVSFSYPGSEQQVLRDVSITIKPGKRLAIVGMNGAGKTTFVKLLCRLYDVSEGKILLDGIDIRELDYASYLKQFSVVFQDFHLFAFPVGQNVAASLNVDEEKAWLRLEQAGVAEKIRQMPNGIDNYLYTNFDAQGVNISGGEAQKISIARALYKNAPIVILDEPTASLDPLSEAEIYSSLNEMINGRTAIYISHRLSSCRFCDEIIVFHEGEIIQQGTHEQLLENAKGKYFELWQAQAQYYVENA